jgi:uncharacterized membrane protein
MQLLASIRRQGLAVPVFTLMTVSGICVALVAYRVVAGCTLAHAYLVWNLFLAWLPLVFAVLAAERLAGTRTSRDRKFLSLAMAWLLFFPNAPYIFTDLVHVLKAQRPTFWSEMLLILLCALTGFMAGFLSLQLMHGLVARLWGRAAGWLFVAGVSGLAGFGVYLGRFGRWNSWDVLTSPVELAKGTGLGFWAVVTQWQHTKFLLLFSLFLLLGYVMLFALTQRHEGSTAKYV